ncbi:AprI/Inh family metalloprotease inhibitor [Methylobacterium sp. M6A4_1b]
MIRARLIAALALGLTGLASAGLAPAGLTPAGLTLAGLTLAGPALAQETAPAPQAAPAPGQNAAPAPGQEAAPAPAAGTPEQPFVESLPRDIAGVPGTWDLSRDGSTRRCVLTLSGASGPAGRRLSFPAGCRRALPILNHIAGWLFADGNLRLVDKDVRPVLQFGARVDARSLVAAAGDEHFSLVPLQIVAMVPPTDAVPTSPGAGYAGAGFAGAAPDARSTAAPEAAPPGEGPAPGTYALDRYREQDVCRIALTPGTAPAPVRILDNCRDGGLTVFDPITWRFANGRLTLNARRGHTVNLIAAGDGRWRRDPEVGTTFVLRRIDSAAP